MKNKIKLFILLILLITATQTRAVHAEVFDVEQEIINQMDYYGIEKYDLAIKSAVGEIEGLEGVSFTEVVLRALRGEMNISFVDVLKLLFGRLLSEVFTNLSIMRNLILIAIFGAVIKCLENSFSSKSIGEIGFYVIYIALVSLLILSFAEVSKIAGSAIAKMSGFMQALIPLVMALLIASGRYAISFVFHPAVMGVTEIAAYVINTVVMKLIIFAAAVQMVNFMVEKGPLDGIAELISGLIGKGLKWAAGIFMAVMSLQTVTAPIVGGAIGKGARLAVGAVPVVGQAFTGAVDSVFYWGNAMKNGVAAGSIVFVIFICFVPIIKLAAIALIYKLASALIKPVADERIVDCLDAMGGYVTLFIGAVMCVAVMFVALLMMVVAGAMG